jgi:thiol-disulfide isomerase/thioredoxin
MAFPYAAMTVLTVLVLVNLLLSFGIVRRLRTHARLLPASAPAPRFASRVLGRPVGDFSAVADSGAPLSTAWLRGAPTVVGFAMPGCRPCHREIPLLAEYLDALPDRTAKALVVVSTLPQEGDDFDEATASLRGLAEVVREPADGPLQTAFGVSMYPSFFIVDPDGIVTDQTGTVAQLPRHALSIGSATA